jgi:hypothetical protein
MGLFRSSSNSPPKHSKVPLRTTSNRAATTNSTINTHHSALHRRNVLKGGEDPAITSARQRVIDAESAEREADRALMTARNAVAEAKAIVKRLEQEAAEEARLARVKQEQAAKLGQRAHPLGSKHTGG